MTTPAQGRTGEGAHRGAAVLSQRRDLRVSGGEPPDGAAGVDPFEDRPLYDVPTQGVPEAELLADSPEDLHARPPAVMPPAPAGAAPAGAAPAGAAPAGAAPASVSPVPVLRRPLVKDPRRRRALAALGLVAAAVVGSAGGWALGSRGDAAPARAQSRTAGAQPSAVPSGAGATAGSAGAAGSTLAGAGPVEPRRAAERLAVGGARVRGEIQQAWSWTDGNGRNFLVLSKDVTRRDGDAVAAATLYVTHVAGRGDELEPLRRPLVDPGVAGCASGFGLDFVENSVRVTDADEDGIAEASAGWWFGCGDDPGPVTLKLALLSNGGRFILRGEGQLASAPQREGASVPPATFDPEPQDRSTWPRGTYDATVQLFGQLFR